MQAPAITLDDTPVPDSLGNSRRVVALLRAWGLHSAPRMGFRAARNLGFLSCISCLSCATGEPDPEGRHAAIIAGQDDDGDPAVVGFAGAFGGVTCTGTIVSRHFIVTAAHCLVDGPPAFAFIGPDLGSATFLDVGSIHMHPDYDPATLQHDLGVVRLIDDSPVDPVPIAARPPEPGEAARFVGYGFTQINQTGEYGRKHQTTVPVTQVDPLIFWYGVATCGGDSGGPALIVEAGREALAGVTSGGDGPCAEYGMDTRVDVHRDWLASFLAEDPPSCDRDGQCAIGCAGADPDCPCAADGECGACPQAAIDPDCPPVDLEPRDEDDPGCAGIGPLPLLLVYLLRRRRNRPRIPRIRPRLSRTI